MKLKFGSKSSIAVALMTMSTLTADALVILLGPKTLGVLLLLTTLMAGLAALFWLLRFGDGQLYFKKNPTILFLALFFVSLGMVLVPLDSQITYGHKILPLVNEALMGPLRAAFLVLGVLLFTAFILVCAALERS